MSNEGDFHMLRSRYTVWFGEEPAEPGACDAIEQALGIVLPSDLREISCFYCGGLMGGISHNAINPGGPADNVVDETLRLRAAVKLPHEFVVLAEPPESLIVLKTAAEAFADATVIWCSAVDVSRLSSMQLVADYDEWPSYRAFFEFLLDLEDEERGG